MQNIETIEARVVGLDKDVKSLEHRMDKVEELCQNVNKLATSVQVMATNMQQMVKEQQRLADIQQSAEERIRSLELEPAEAWSNAKKSIISCVISTLGGVLIGSIIALL
jgi:uncharacterized protein YoxC